MSAAGAIIALIAAAIGFVGRVFIGSHAQATLEDVGGCNGPVHIHFNADGAIVLRGPRGHEFDIQNWRLEHRRTNDAINE